MNPARQADASVPSARALKTLYEQGVNIMSLFRERSGSSQNSADAALISYDLQSGSYLRALDDPAHRVQLNRYAEKIAEVIRPLGAASILEAGVGEATTLRHVMEKLTPAPTWTGGFDLCWSRIVYAREYVSRSQSIRPTLFTGDLARIPLPDNAVDLVFTSHAIEPNHGREEPILRELLRVSRRWVALFEPSYELGNELTRRRVEEHGYCRGLPGVAEGLGARVVEHRLLGFDWVAHNQTGLVLLEKSGVALASGEVRLGCPCCHHALDALRGNHFCPECLTVYPTIDGIPCLLPANGILASKYSENDLHPLTEQNGR